MSEITITRSGQAYRRKLDDQFPDLEDSESTELAVLDTLTYVSPRTESGMSDTVSYTPETRRILRGLHEQGYIEVRQ